MYPNLLKKSINKALRRFIDLLFTLRLHSPQRNDTIALRHIIIRGRCKLYTLSLTDRILHKLNTPPNSANSFVVPECFADPETGKAKGAERLDMRAVGDEDGVEHGGAHALQVVVGLSGFLAAGSLELLPFWGDDEREGAL